MRKLRTQLLVFFTALIIGLAASYFNVRPLTFAPETNSESIISNTASVQVLDKQKDEPTEFYDISPCDNENYFKKYSINAVTTRSIGNVNWRIECGVLPEYPQNRNNINGSVTVSVLIDGYGEVEKASVISGNGIFHNLALQAARQTRFIPVQLRGEPIKVRGVLIYEFDSERGVWLPKVRKPF